MHSRQLFLIISLQWSQRHIMVIQSHRAHSLIILHIIDSSDFRDLKALSPFPNTFFITLIIEILHRGPSTLLLSGHLQSLSPVPIPLFLQIPFGVIQASQG